MDPDEFDSSEFDWIKGFAGVDLLAVDAVGKVIGHTVASIYQGMVEAGLSEETAMNIINSAVGTFFAVFISSTINKKEEEEK